MAADLLNYHAARVLLLVDAFTKPKSGRLDGLTKVAKLDFLLRYPVFLEHVLRTRGVEIPSEAAATPDEAGAVESQMIRYKFGPWDNRYYPIIGRLVATGLVELVPGKGRVALRITHAGHDTAASLASSSWLRIASRCVLLRRHLNLTGNRLKELIYRELPEVVDRPWWSEIPGPETNA